MKSLICALSVILVFTACVSIAGETVPEQEAKRLGAKKCLKTVGLVADFYLEQASHGADTTWNKNNTDNRMLSFFVSRGYSDGDSQVNIQFAPNAAGGCDAVFTETYVIESTCTIVREDTFKAWKYRGNLNNKTLILQNSNSSVDVYLTPSGKKSDLCLVTKREVIY